MNIVLALGMMMVVVGSAAAQPERVKQDSLKAIAVPESLSTEIPVGLVSQPPAAYRLKALPGWLEDGTVTDWDGFQKIAEAGDYVALRIRAGSSVEPGEKLIIYRKSGPSEEDGGAGAVYLAKIGQVEIKGSLGRSRYRAVVIECSDAIQEGDVAKREE